MENVTMSDFYDTDPYRTNISDLACLEAPAAIGTLRLRGGEMINCAIWSRKRG
jgi:hypothetical protein